MPLPAETFKVFISHATAADGSLANWMADALDRLHIRAYVYERYQIGGQNRFETIKTMISACPYFLVILTTDGIISQWVNQEIGYAVAVGKSPIPIIEVDSLSNKNLGSKGFVELHDQISYYRSHEGRLMADIIRTFYSLLSSIGKWQDLFFLSCVCGNDFEGNLDFSKNWYDFINKYKQPFTIDWSCSKCGQRVTLSFPDCHLISN